MTRPVAPNGVMWRGAATLSLTAEFQAGRMVVASLKVEPANMPYREESLIRYRLLTALADYRCPGDFIFAQ